MRKFTTVLTFTIINLIASANLFGQASVSGSLSGSVTDANKAADAGASVKLVIRQTNTELTATTNDSGFYSFPRLAPGIYEQFERQLAAQNRLVARYRILSPAVVMQEILNDIAGTSTERQKSYVEQIRAQIGELQGYLVPKLMRREFLTAADFDRIPRFQFREESASTITNRAIVGVLLLAIPAALLGAFAYFQLRKFSPLG